MMKIKNKLIPLILASLIILLATVIDVPISSATIYRSYIDQDYGFYRVIVLKDNATNISYINKTLNINVGDTLIWMNDATPDEELNIISEQGLWNGTARLRWNYQIFNYTFNDPGIYTFHIKEYPRLRQTIIVKSKNITGIISPNVTMTPIIIPTVNITAVNETTTPIINETTIGKKSPGFDIIIVIVSILFVYKKFRMIK